MGSNRPPSNQYRTHRGSQQQHPTHQQYQPPPRPPQPSSLGNLGNLAAMTAMQHSSPSAPFSYNQPTMPYQPQHGFYHNPMMQMQMPYQVPPPNYGMPGMQYGTPMPNINNQYNYGMRGPGMMMGGGGGGRTTAEGYGISPTAGSGNSQGRQRLDERSGRGGINRPPPTVDVSKAPQAFPNLFPQQRSQHHQHHPTTYNPSAAPSQPFNPTLAATSSQEFQRASKRPLPTRVPIEGTSVTLDTAEDIAKWIEERKKRWPTNKRVAEKEKVKQERIAKGLERPPSTFSRGGRGGRGGRGRGRGRGGFSVVEEGERESKRMRFEREEEGGGMLRTEEHERTGVEAGLVDYDSEDEEVEAALGVDGVGTASVYVKSELVEGIKRDPEDHPHLFANGRPETLQDTAIGEPHDGNEDEAEGSGPEQETTQQLPLQPSPPTRGVCKWWRMGRCRNGSSCKFLHQVPNDKTTQTTDQPHQPHQQPQQQKKKPRGPKPPPVNPFEKTDLLGKLLHNDIAHEMNDLLQVIEFLSRNGWLKDVELRPGDADGALIQEVGSTEDQGAEATMR